MVGTIPEGRGNRIHPVADVYIAYGAETAGIFSPIFTGRRTRCAVQHIFEVRVNFFSHSRETGEAVFKI